MYYRSLVIFLLTMIWCPLYSKTDQRKDLATLYELELEQIWGSCEILYYFLFGFLLQGLLLLFCY